MKKAVKVAAGVLSIVGALVAGFFIGNTKEEPKEAQMIVALYANSGKMENCDAMNHVYKGVYDPDLEESDINNFVKKIQTSLEEEFDSEEFEVEAWVPSMHDFMMNDYEDIFFTVHMNGELLEQYSYHLRSVKVAGR